MKKMGLILLVVLLIIPLVAVAGCKGKESEAVKTTTASFKNVNKTGGEFDFRVFKRAVEEDKKGDEYANVFLSPESLRIALMMTYNGAAGETEKAMAEVLGIQGMTLEEANEGSATLLAALEEAGQGAQVEIANSLWGKKGLEFNKDFIERNKEFYDAEVKEINNAEEINKWVSEKTHGKIDKIVERIDPLTILFLINALYFKGECSEKFDTELTEDKDFTLQDGSKKKAQLMQQSGEYKYLEDDGFQAVELPYGDEEKVSMYIFLPREDKDLKGFVEILGSENWEKWMSGFSPREGDISIPRFKLEYEKKLVPTLEALGMGIAFTEQADFEKMISKEKLPAEEKVYISDVLQKTFVEVNEEGTEAAAVTKVEVAVTAAPPGPEERFEMVVDHPFFFAIRNNETDTLLFMGLIVDPGE